MSLIQIDPNPDLKKLRDEGYAIEIKEGHLLVYSVPYVNSRGEISHGILVSKLETAGDKTVAPQDHVIHFIGDHPCHQDGSIISGIKNVSETKVLTEGITINHSFSNKYKDRTYFDYYEKITTYINIISSEAQAIDPSQTAKTFEVFEDTNPESPFKYFDTNSSRAEITAISNRVKGLKIGIIGVGGTGSYILDLVTKTPVGEIHIFDKDTFLSHNSFRCPGAASLDELREQVEKVTYLQRNYSKIHKYIIPHAYYITKDNVDELRGINFIFISMDDGASKKIIIEKLTEYKIPFIDVGMGVEEINGKLKGKARVTTGTAEKADHLSERIPYADAGNDLYKQNIQIAELNSINAALAVIKWKKMFGIYHDADNEHNTFYDIYTNKLINEDNIV